MSHIPCAVAGDVGHVRGLDLTLTVYDDWRTPEINACAVPDGSVVIYASFLDAIDNAFSDSRQRDGALAFIISHEVQPALTLAKAV